MQTLAQAHERLHDLTNQMRRLSKGFSPDEADRAAELAEAVAVVDEVLTDWFAMLNPAPVAEKPAPAPKAAATTKEAATTSTAPAKEAPKT